jgi:hypothetical protein
VFVSHGSLYAAYVLERPNLKLADLMRACCMASSEADGLIVAVEELSAEFTSNATMTASNPTPSWRHDERAASPA